MGVKTWTAFCFLMCDLLDLEYLLLPIFLADLDSILFLVNFSWPNFLDRIYYTFAHLDPWAFETGTRRHETLKENIEKVIKDIPKEKYVKKPSNRTRKLKNYLP